jgi:hypothetical protein
MSAAAAINAGSARDRFSAQLKAAEMHYRRFAANGERRKGLIIRHAMEAAYGGSNNLDYIKGLSFMRHAPVPITEFLESKEFLGGGRFEMWDSLKTKAVEMCPDIMIGEAPKHLVLNGGATGTGKSFMLQLKSLYTMYFLTCFRTPQLIFDGLNRFTPIILVMQSASRTTTNRVLYKPVRDIFLSMPYTQKYVQYDKDKEGELHFHDRIQLTPTLASVQAVIGQAIIDAGIDEANFMERVENSKQVAGPDGGGGYYDQVKEIYQVLRRRRKGRFITRGYSPGGIYVSSSVHYEDDFLEKEMAEGERIDAAAGGSSEIKVFRNKQYEVVPQTRFVMPRFRFLVGTNDYAARVLKDGEVPGKDFHVEGRVLEIPGEYLPEFEADPEGSQRDVCGIASAAINRFMPQVQKITEAVDRGRKLGLKQWVVKANVDLGRDGLPKIVAENLPFMVDRDRPRYAHIDLGVKKDRCGIVIASVREFIDVETEDGQLESVPVYDIEMAVSIKPSATAELDIEEMRAWLTSFKTAHGINIVSVTMDGFESRESRQAFRKAGIASDYTSVDRTMEPYEVLKRAFYQDRINTVQNELMRVELATLQVNEKKGKVDHTPKGSKDVADAAAGAVFGALRAKKTRAARKVGAKPKPVQRPGMALQEPIATGRTISVPASYQPPAEVPEPQRSTARPSVTRRRSRADIARR